MSNAFAIYLRRVSHVVPVVNFMHNKAAGAVAGAAGAASLCIRPKINPSNFQAHLATTFHPVTSSSSSRFLDKSYLDPPAANLEASPGELGKPVILPKDMSPEMKKAVDDGWTKNAFNQYVSDLISVHRSLPDPRDAWCKDTALYLSNLPKTDVIICFHNEAWSVLLRTVHSVLDRSPKELIGDIILVDDFSDMREYSNCPNVACPL